MVLWPGRESCHLCYDNEFYLHFGPDRGPGWMSLMVAFALLAILLCPTVTISVVDCLLVGCSSPAAHG